MYSFLFAFLLFFPNNAPKKTVALSKEAHISIITCDPWQGELYAAFGHSAIRVYDPQQGINIIFNYGIFDFNQSHFYLNFTRGYLLYELRVSNYADFVYAYMYHNRTLTEQVLNFAPAEKQRLFDFLSWNAKPENRGYLYNYYHDNCATRIRDALEMVLPEELIWDSSFISTEYTMRDLERLYLSGQPWGDLGINICFGLPVDRMATAYEYMFLPEYLMVFLDKARIVSGQKKRSLVSGEKIIFKGGPEEVHHNIPHPWVVFGAVLLITAGISIYDFRRKKISRWLDTILLVATGAVGWLLLFLWFGTNHTVSRYNFNLLWALPSNVVLAVMLWSGKRKFLRYYFRVAFWLTFGLLITWIWLPQPLPVFLLPVVISMGIRYGLHYQMWTHSLLEKS